MRVYKGRVSSWLTREQALMRDGKLFTSNFVFLLVFLACVKYSAI